mgnify:FL=1
MGSSFYERPKITLNFVLRATVNFNMTEGEIYDSVGFTIVAEISGAD